MNQILPFLKNLTENNDRDWFKAHKKEYDQSRKAFVDLVDKVIVGLSSFEPQVMGLTSKAAIFRIYRDVRFSNDKRPYKTHYGAFLAENGRKSTKAGYYFHIAPNECFLGGGLYRPNAEQLKKIRAQIDYNAQSLRDIVSQQNFKTVYGSMQGEQLKTAPRDYPKDHPDIDLLRYKDFLGTHQFSEAVLNDNPVDYIVERFEVLKPFVDYFNDALMFEDEEPKVNF
jgi:uncharacterized protein (TIGR02453 family)